ncbi:MAG TPA: hypothetical protein VGL98_16925 [Gammaproteobacteria bacterium]
MKAIVTIVLMLLAASAAAQSQRRAPLANVDDLEPAVDVSEPRVAIAQGPALPATPAPAPAAAPTSPTPAAAPPPTPARAEPSPQAAERPAPRVMDTLDLGTTSITGNAELPKVLYIVPWKKSDLGDLVGRPVNTLLDEVLAPVDPAVFERHLSYYDSLYGKREQE